MVPVTPTQEQERMREHPDAADRQHTVGLTTVGGTAANGRQWGGGTAP